jgi:hypothetical protein
LIVISGEMPTRYSCIRRKLPAAAAQTKPIVWPLPY